MRILTFSGSPLEMGRAFGETCREAIQQFYEIRVRIAIEQALVYGGRTIDENTVLEAATACLKPTEEYHPEGFEELAGIAEGSGLSTAQILALNGLTDLRDYVAWSGKADECSAFVVAGDKTADGQLICGQTWDLATNNMPFVLGVHRIPDNGPQTWTMTTVGCLSLIGLNSEGIAVGTTNVRTTDAKPGVVYLSILHKMLAQTSIEDAIDCVEDAPRASGHFYFVADAQGKGAAMECTGSQYDLTQVNEGIYVHCNHCLIPAHQAFEGPEPSSSSLHRTSRLQHLFEEHPERNDCQAARDYLADTDGGEDAICRDDPEGVSSNGAVVMVPSTGSIRACHGPPNRSEWVDLKG